jgi:CheY-like chemotaxis protein
MTRILAIEPDPERSALLQRLVQDAIEAHVVLVASTDAAMAAMEQSQPDLILASTLLTPRDEQNLVTHLRQTPSLRHLPILTIPAVMDQPEVATGGLMSRLMRRQKSSRPSYDFSAVITRIEEALEQSRAEAAAAALDDASPAPPVIDGPSLVLTTQDEQALSSWGLGPERKRAQRWTNSQLPWLASVKLSWGLELRLLNISSTGVLVESGVALAPGTTTTFQLRGPHQDMVVPGRVVRNRVATVNGLGVRYQAAAVFDTPFDALAAPDSNAIDPVEHLADLVASVREQAACGAHPADLRAEFEAGVLKLVTAREVRLRDVPVVENDGRESVYFTIAAPDSTPAVLQVTFEPDYQPVPEEFDALVAAAQAAAKVLPLTETARQVSVPARAARRNGGQIRLVPPAASREEMRESA